MTSGGRDGTNGGLEGFSPRTIRWAAFAVFAFMTTAQAVANAAVAKAEAAGALHDAEGPAQSRSIAAVRVRRASGICQDDGDRK